jgi:glycine dehydrogenase
MLLHDFANRHIGPREHELNVMLEVIGVKTLDELISKTIPDAIRLKEELNLPAGMSEFEYMKYIWKVASVNKVYKSFIGMGYYNTVVPPAIHRNILENPSWYTSYTPYQAEISQGRLEALLNFQTAIVSLTGMEIANASLLDESTAAAEAMNLLYNSRSREAIKNGVNVFVVDHKCFPQTIDVLKTRSAPLDIELIIVDIDTFKPDEKVFGILCQYPDADGSIRDYKRITEQAHAFNIGVAVAADILSLALLTPPGEWGADVVFGSTQRFGIPMGYGGPYAAYFATVDKYKRNMPGRIIGVTVDARGKRALRMALQTREQHIKREKATSNICTAQALLAIMAGMYVVYHGKQGLLSIASRVHEYAHALVEGLISLGFAQHNQNYFDTLKISIPDTITVYEIEQIALEKEINLRYIDNKTIGISLDETTTLAHINAIMEVFATAVRKQYKKVKKLEEGIFISTKFKRNSDFLSHELFNKYHSETELMRYIKKLERKDISLTHSMISLGSCTMKLNAATEMMALSWPEFGEIHPFVPIDQTEGYQNLFHELGNFLKEITGFDAVSFQPNSGAAGEYAGLLVVRQYHMKRGEAHRKVALIPASAHGTNPASAAMAGMDVVVIKCDEKGNIDISDLKEKATQYKDTLSVFMVTYPSTHGVFETEIMEMARIVHENGGQVYMDGANMNAQVGYTNPARIGADLCHLNLHKTFAIPHGGGGPGVGPIAVASHLVEFLPTHPVIETGGIHGTSAVSSAPWGSASILTISHAYCKLLGGEGLKKATAYAILNANYIAASLKKSFDILYTGTNGFVAHEMIVDCRKFKQTAGISEADIAKRLMDYGFHAPTLSFPVHGTLMIEPTESESKQELDRFVDALISICGEINEISQGKVYREDNVLVNAPHTAEVVSADTWEHSYTRKQAAYPLEWIADNKYWPPVSRVDDAYGDRNLVCTCSSSLE